MTLELTSNKWMIRFPTSSYNQLPTPWEDPEVCLGGSGLSDPEVFGVLSDLEAHAGPSPRKIRKASYKFKAHP